MSVNLACIFPNILPEEGLIFPLLQFYDQVFFLRPVEDDLPELETALLQAVAGENQGGGRLGYICPAPLKGDREKFLTLFRDIQLHPEDYAGHLGNLSAGLGTALYEDEREHSIMDTLLQQTGIRAGNNNTSEQEKEQEKNTSLVLLWQARLLLKLGEFMDRNQAEIRRDLESMSLQEHALFRELREEGDSDLSAQGISLSLPDEDVPVVQQQLRLKAWARLFVLSEESFATTVFITRSFDAIESLLEKYQQGSSVTPKTLLSLPLPAVVVDDDAVLDIQNRFQEEAAPLLSTIKALPTMSGLSFSDQAEEEWAALLERHYPAAKHGRCILTLYYLADVIPPRLFLETFSPRDAYHPMKGHKKTGMLLGLIEKQER